MSHLEYLLDLKGLVWQAPSGTLVSPEQWEALPGPTVVITDYQAAPFGVEALPAHHPNLAPLLEKRLRDAGDIDGLARVIIHARERQGELAQVCYTAIPVAVSMRYQRWIKQQSHHVLLFPLLDALLMIARQEGLQNGVLAFSHDDSIDVLVLLDGQAMHASRQRLYTHGTDDHSRIAAYLSAHLGQGKGSDGRADCLLVERTEGESQSLVEALKEHGIQATAPVLPVTRLFKGLSLKRADINGLSRALYLCHRTLPWLAAGLAALCLSSVFGALYWKHEANTLQAELRYVQSESVSNTLSDMGAALNSADELVLSQRERADFVRLAERVRQTPDPATLIRHLRQTVPASIELVEAGIVSDDTGVLIIVAGRSASVAAPFAAEEQFVTALNRLGYEVVRREISSGLGDSLFRLALTWSAP